MTKAESWNIALRREIAEQKALIKRMDNNPDLPTGIMGQIRAGRLEALEELLEYEAEDERGPLPITSEEFWNREVGP